MNHDGRNLKAPGVKRYTLTLRIEPPTFIRLDELNGKRYAETVEVTFQDLTRSVAKLQNAVLKGRF